MNANGKFLNQSRGKAPVLTNPDGPNVGQASRLPGGMDVWFEKSLLLRTSEPGGKMPPSTAAKMAAATDVNPTLNTYQEGERFADSIRDALVAASTNSRSLV